MPAAQLECSICISSRSPYAQDDVQAKSWVVLPVCGHIYHEACIDTTWSRQRQREKPCPTCRADAATISRKLNDGKRKRMCKVKLFFHDNLSSDANSQMVDYNARAGEDDDEDDDDESDDQQQQQQHQPRPPDDMRRMLSEKTIVLRQAQQDLQALRIQLANVTNERDAALQSATLVQQRLEDTADALEETTEQYELVSEQLQEAQDDVARLESLDAARLSEQLQEALREIEELEMAQLEKEEAAQEVLREAQQSHQTEKRQLELELRLARQQIAKEGHAGARRIEQLEKDLHHQHEENDRLIGKLDQIRSELAKTKRDYDHRLASEANEKLSGQRLKQQLETQVESLKRGNAGWKEKYHALKGDLAALRAKYDALHQRKTVIAESPPPEGGSPDFRPTPPRQHEGQAEDRDSDADLPTSGQRRAVSPLPFRLNTTHNQIPPIRSHGKQRKQSPFVDDSEEDSDDIEIVEVAKPAAGPRTESIFRRKSPSSPAVGMPLLASQSRHALKSPKRKLTAQPSDQHLPDFTKLFDSGPKLHKKLRR